jgi:transaldolase
MPPRRKKKYRSLAAKAAEEAIAFTADRDQQLSLCLDRVAVNFSLEILKIVPGRVSTEADTRLSFKLEGTITKTRDLIRLYKEVGIGRERILIKVAATREGIKAAEVSEKERIRCNLTLLFSFIQAVMSAEASVTLVSHFVGRLLDRYRNERDIVTHEFGDFNAVNLLADSHVGLFYQNQLAACFGCRLLLGAEGEDTRKERDKQNRA